MASERFPVISRRLQRVKRLQTMQHVLAAIVLALNAKTHLEHGHAVVMPSLEIIAALLLVGAAVRDQMRRTRGQAHDRVGWVEIAGGVMTLVEAIAKTREPHHLSFLVLGFVQPLVLFLFGFFDIRIATAHYLAADDERFTVRMRLLFGRSVAWKEVRAFRIKGRELEIDSTSGKRTLSLDVVNFDAAKEWTLEQFRRRGFSPAE